MSKVEYVRVSSGEPARVIVNAMGMRGPAGTRRVELSLYLEGDLPTNRRVHRYVVTGAMTIRPADSMAMIETAPTQDLVIDIRNAAGASVGSLVFTAGETTGTLVMSQTVFARGDVLDFYTPAVIVPPTNMLSVTVAGDR